MDFKGKNVVVTGGSSGLGLELVKQFLESGAEVFTCSRDLSELQNATKNLDSDKLHTYQCDVADPKSIELFVDSIDKIDILVNCAGVWLGGEVADNKVEDISRTIDINLKGTILVTREVLLKNNEQDLHILNVSSTTGTMPRPESTVYAASKWGVTGFTESLKERYKGTNIKVFGVYPGGMRTAFFEADAKDVSDFMDPADIAAEIINILETSDRIKKDFVVINRP